MKSSLPRAPTFLRDRRGATAIIFGLAAIPTFAFIGFAMDYGVALTTKAKLDIAADAASMVAINTAKTVIQGSASPSAATATAIQQGQAQALLAFKANAGAVPYATLTTPVVTLARVNQTLTATVSYSTVVKNNFSGMIGFPQSNMQGSSASTLTMPTYINYYIVTDISQSMGVAATATDMQNLYNRVIQYGNYDTAASKTAKTGCVFGCHVQQVSGSYTQPITNETLAHSATYGSYINLRIDAAKSAIQAILNDAAAANQQSGMNLIQIGLYTMQQDPTNSGSYIQNISAPPSSNFTSMSTAVTNTMDLGANTGAGIGDSGFANSLNYFVSNVISMQGDGSTPSTALNYVFLITDGLSDVPNTNGSNCTSGHCTNAFDNNLCGPIKSKATLGVIYTTYNPIYNANQVNQGYQTNYQQLVLPYVNAIPGNLLACSSGTNYYFEAADGPAITTAMKNLFAPTIQAARIAR